MSLGGELRWLTGSPGTRQLYRILDALFSSEVQAELPVEGGHALPRRLLPARALVIALSPLLDERGIKRAARAARPRVRPRRPRDLAGRGRAARRPRVPSLEASARRAALALRDTRHSGRALGAHARRRRAGDRGGDHITAPRTTPRARLTTAIGAVVLAALAAAATAESLAVATTAPLLLSLALLAGRAAPVCRRAAAAGSDLRRPGRRPRDTGADLRGSTAPHRGARLLVVGRARGRTDRAHTRVAGGPALRWANSS